MSRVFVRHCCDGCGFEFDVDEDGGELAERMLDHLLTAPLEAAIRLLDFEPTFCSAECRDRLVDVSRDERFWDEVRDSIGELMRSVGLQARAAEARAEDEPTTEVYAREQPCERIQRPELHEPEVAHRCGTFSAQAILSRKETVGDMLRRVREDAGLTLLAMSQRMGLSVSEVSSAERDTRRLTDAELERWADAVGTHPDALVPVTLGERMKSDPDVVGACDSLAKNPPSAMPFGFSGANDPPIRPLGTNETQRPNQPDPADTELPF